MFDEINGMPQFETINIWFVFKVLSSEKRSGADNELIRILKQETVGKTQTISSVTYDIADMAMKTEACNDYWATYKNAIKSLYKNRKAGCGVAFGNSKIAVVCLYKSM